MPWIPARSCSSACAISCPAGWSPTPVISAAYTHTDASGFAEHGGGLAEISLDGYGAGVWKTPEGVALAHERGLSLLGMTVTPQLHLGLSQEVAAGGGAAHGSFSNGSPLALALGRSGSNFVDTGLGADFALSDSITGYLAYQNNYSPHETRDNAKPGVSIRF